jgi:DNA-binding transcriptional LysR family regulator
LRLLDGAAREQQWRDPGRRCPNMGMQSAFALGWSMLDLDAVYIVMALARDGSVARASRTLGIPRTTLTRRVEMLEVSLGVRLVERNQRHFRLTEAGRMLVQQGSPLVDAARQVEATLQSREHDRLRTALPPGLGWDMLDPIFGISKENLDIELVYTDRELHPIRDDFDLVVSFAPPTDGALFCRSILRLQWRCVASASYLEAHGSPAQASDLCAHRCVAFRVHGGVAPFAWPLRAGDVMRVKPWFVSTCFQAATEMVLAGRGIGLLPDLPTPTAGDLITVLPEVGADQELFVTMGQRLSDSARGRRVQELIEKGKRLLRGVRPKRIKGE